MKIEFVCKNNIRRYNYIAVSISPKSSYFDKFIIDEIVKKADINSKKVNPLTANNSQEKRNQDDITVDCFTGIISEYAWKYCINLLSIDINIKEIKEINIQNQIDLICIKNQKTIEVRSSFVRNGIDFAIFNDKFGFDIIGPYENEYKITENAKDFYVRVLFHYNNKEKNKFIQSVMVSDTTNPFDIYLVGGATWEMMNNTELYKIKHLSSEEMLGSFDKSGNTNYRTIPIIKALDTIEIIKLILS